MEIKYITIPLTATLETAEVRERREIRERVNVAVGMAQVALGVACFVCILALLLGMAMERKPVESEPETVNESQCLLSESQCLFSESEDNHPTAADLYVIEYENRVNNTPLTDDEYAVLVDACEGNGIPVAVGLGLIEVESNFHRDAVSPVGCYGLTQLNPKYFPSDLSPEDNIRYGMNYLGACLNRYGTIAAALTAYNAGYDTGSRWYANKVLDAAQGWED